MSIVTGLYARAAQWRRAWYARHPERRRTLAQPVISVGNLTVGGSGKSPTVATLARLLREMGERPAILSRGYRRRDSADGVVVVSDGARVLVSAAASGDEPQMLARALPGVPVLVARERYLAGVLAERQFGATVHLLDDGFQHLPLTRDVDLLIVSPDDLDEAMLPAGRLREPLATARQADALLVPGGEDDAEAVATALGIRDQGSGIGLFRLSRHHAPLPGDVKHVVAVAGIARPRRFFDALRAQGYEVVREIAFRDHHWFSARDVAEVERAARDAGADAIVTTEKDLARLNGAPGIVGRGLSASPGGPDKARPTGVTTWLALPMRIEIEPRDRFVGWLAERLQAARARRGAAA